MYRTYWTCAEVARENNYPQVILVHWRMPLGATRHGASRGREKGSEQQKRFFFSNNFPPALPVIECNFALFPCLIHRHTLRHIIFAICRLQLLPRRHISSFLGIISLLFIRYDILLDTYVTQRSRSKSTFVVFFSFFTVSFP